ncbi:MAG: VWA domain-containing protein [Rhodomicrobium sp.]|nr:VWA domain-containing protein [Rhodomicrobium sp.]
MPASRVTSASPWHIVLLLDDSSSLAGEPAQILNKALRDMIAEMEIAAKGTKPYFKISIILFGSSSRIIAEAVSERDIDLDRVAVFSGSSGSTNIGSALATAANLLERNPGRATDFRPFVFLFSDGLPDDAQEALTAAQRLKSLNIPAGSPTIVCIGLGDTDVHFMKSVASSPELFLRLSDPMFLTRFFPAIGTVAGSKTGEASIKQAIMNI